MYNGVPNVLAILRMSASDQSLSGRFGSLIYTGMVRSLSFSNLESIVHYQRTRGLPLTNQGPSSRALCLSPSSENLKRWNPLPLDSTCKSPLVLQSCLKYRARAGTYGLRPTKYPMSTRSQCTAAFAISSGGQTAILTPFLRTSLKKLRARGDQTLVLELEHLSAQEAGFSTTEAETKGLWPRDRDR